MRTSIHLILLLLLLPYASFAQSDSNPASSQYPYKNLNSSMTIIIVIFVVIFFLIALMSIYIRHCFDNNEEWSSSSNSTHQRSSTTRFWKRNQGLDTSLVESFPTFSFSEIKDRKIGNAAAASLECAVCLNELDDGEILRLLPKCGHVFHRDCIDNWIVSHNTCPVCRTDLSKKNTARIVDSTTDVVGETVLTTTTDHNQISITISNVVVHNNTFPSSENLKPEKEIVIEKLRRSRSTGELPSKVNSCGVSFSSEDDRSGGEGSNQERSGGGDGGGGWPFLRRTGSAAENGRSTVCDCNLAVKIDGDARPLTVPV
ncbi:RING-H2 finger protein ATL32-like [Impatiens glandulifera]|uniref:RING-H2 finger protein ATL32-like n=1 Tax=Impatiens glandulifera TaxID=253017 RepID=UPI001FB0C7A9|nr:RING-H2 finger protein ATL32-like [Impatiens glandulifera]